MSKPEKKSQKWDQTSSAKDDVSQEAVPDDTAQDECGECDTGAACSLDEDSANAEAADSDESAADAEPDAGEDDIVSEAEEILADVEVQDVDALVEAARKEAADWQDKYLRLHAEWDTYRRRTNEQREQEKIRATEKLVVDLIPVLDDFERSIDYAEKNGEEGLLDGVRAVYSKVLDALTKSKVEVIDPAGQAFDALEAQAVATVPDEEAYDETVAEVYQKGYRMGKKVLRAAMVTVTTGGPKRPTQEEAEE